MRRKMKRASKILSVVAVACAAIAALVALDRRPMAISDVVEQAFHYRLKEAPTVVAREWKKPLAIQGVAYFEETTLRLSEADYRGLIAQLSGDRSFQKKETASGPFYDRFVLGKEIVSYQPRDASTHEFWYSYTQY